MNLKKFRGVFLGALILALPFSSSNAFAYETFNNHVLNGGVGNYGNANRYYFIDSSASSSTTYIDASMNNWIYTTSRLGISTPISFVKTSNKSSSVMDIYYQSVYPESNGVSGFAEHYLYQQKVDYMSQNWGWGKIVLNSPTYANVSFWEKYHTPAHEMGHVFGLAHTKDVNAVMCKTSDGALQSSPQKDDLNGINYLY